MREGNVSPKLRDHLSHSWKDLGAIEGNLVAAAGTDAVKSLMVISGSGGEGRTTAATCLGWALAASGKTLLIDAHINSPDLSRTFSVPTEPGLSDVILDGVDLAKAVHSTEAEGLYILPGGRQLTNTSAVFRREGFGRLLGQLRQAWDYVVCDTPAFLAESDASVMARHFDGAILIAECERTRWEVARLVVERLEASNGRLIGAALNRRRFYIPRAIYQML